MQPDNPVTSRAGGGYLKGHVAVAPSLFQDSPVGISPTDAYFLRPLVPLRVALLGAGFLPGLRPGCLGRTPVFGADGFVLGLDLDPAAGPPRGRNRAVSR